MRKVISLAIMLALAVCTLSSCAWIYSVTELEPYGSSADGAEDSSVTSDTLVGINAPQELPFKEGCYSNDAYVLQLTCTGGDNGSYEYGVMLYTPTYGIEKFFGLARGVLENDSKITVYDSDDSSCYIDITKIADDDNEYEQREILKLLFYGSGGQDREASGEYIYKKSQWSFDETSSAYTSISPGKYICGEYVLTVTYGNGNFSYVIVDSENKQVLSASQSGLPDTTQSSQVDYMGVTVMLSAGEDQNGIYIDVSAQSTATTPVPFVGIYEKLQ